MTFLRRFTRAAKDSRTTRVLHFASVCLINEPYLSPGETLDAIIILMIIHLLDSSMTDQTFLVGTGVHSIYACSLTSSGQLKLIGENSCGEGSSWLYARDQLLYAVNEFTGKIETFAIDDRRQGTLSLKNTVSSMGNTPCYLDLDPSGKWLAVAK